MTLQPAQGGQRFAPGRATTPSLVEIYEQRWKQFELFALSEACVELDRQILTWRSNHVRMVERMIGDRAIGTGGTEGSRYLTSTTRYRFFPRALGRAQCFDRSKRRPDVDPVLCQNSALLK